MIWIQHIETWWLKNERGAQAGTLRGKTPDSLALPPTAASRSGRALLLHRVQFRRSSSKVDAELLSRPLSPITVGCVHIVPDDTGAQVGLLWSVECGGKPVRWQNGSEPKWRLGSGEWAQFRYNGRIDLEQTWRYHVTTVNVGFFEHVDADVFLRTEPAHRYNSLVKLR